MNEGGRARAASLEPPLDTRDEHNILHGSRRFV